MRSNPSLIDWNWIWQHNTFDILACNRKVIKRCPILLFTLLYANMPVGRVDVNITSELCSLKC